MRKLSDVIYIGSFIFIPASVVSPNVLLFMQIFPPAQNFFFNECQQEHQAHLPLLYL